MRNMAQRARHSPTTFGDYEPRSFSVSMKHWVSRCLITTFTSGGAKKATSTFARIQKHINTSTHIEGNRGQPSL